MPAEKRRIGLMSAWASRANGGVFEAVVAQTDIVRKCGYEPVIIALSSPHDEVDRHRFGNAEVLTTEAVGPGGIGFAPGMGRVLQRANLDLLHLHGIWTLTSRDAARWSHGGKLPYVISPHGMLDPWILSRSSWKKRIAALAYERQSWRNAGLIHALTQDEAADITSTTGLHTTVVIPNAILPNEMQRQEGRRTVIYLGRIHPKKNVASLISAWRLLEDVGEIPTDAQLVIAGWGEKEHITALNQQIESKPGDSVIFVGPIYAEAKAKMLASARFLALPSYSEGLPVAILEAWASGTPTLMSVHCHLEEGFTSGAAINSGTSCADIAIALRIALHQSQDEWEIMSRQARMLVQTTFSYDIIIQKWQAVYDRLLSSLACESSL